MAGSKTSQAVSLYRSGQLKRALAIAKTFRLGLTADEQKAISLAYECFTHPEFYRQLGTDIEARKQAGCRVFEQRIMGAPQTDSRAGSQIFAICSLSEIPGCLTSTCEDLEE